MNTNQNNSTLRISLPHGVNALILRQNKILTCQRKTSDLWSYPGGKIGEGESPRQALIREVQEETGILLTENQCLFYYEGLCKNKDPSDKPYWVYSFLCELGEKQSPMQMPEEPPFAWLTPTEFLEKSAFPEFNFTTMKLAGIRFTA